MTKQSLTNQLPNDDRVHLLLIQSNLGDCSTTLGYFLQTQENNVVSKCWVRIHTNKNRKKRTATFFSNYFKKCETEATLELIIHFAACWKGRFLFKLLLNEWLEEKKDSWREVQIADLLSDRNWHKSTVVSRFSGLGSSTSNGPLNRDSPLNGIIPNQ